MSERRSLVISTGADQCSGICCSVRPFHFLLLQSSTTQLQGDSILMADLHFVHYASDSSSPRGYSETKQPVNTRVPRPMNSWILFRAQTLRDFQESDPDFRAPQGVISKLVSDLWKSAHPKTRQEYEDLAKRGRIEHAKKYPNYRFKFREKSLKLHLNASTKLQMASTEPISPSSVSSSSPSTVYTMPISPTKDSFDLGLWPVATSNSDCCISHPLPYFPMDEFFHQHGSESLWNSAWIPGAMAIPSPYQPDQNPSCTQSDYPDLGPEYGYASYNQ